MKKGIVIGAGASGLMAAITLAEYGCDVTILEHTSKIGKKILSTGNGRCNLTNLNIDESCYYSENSSFPMKVISRFTPNDTIAFFKKIGVITKDIDGYVYPYCEQAKTVLNALINYANTLKINIITDCEVNKITCLNDLFSINTSLGEFTSEVLIISAGSKAAKVSGSDGSGYALAKSLGHNVITPLPALTSLKCKEKFFKSIAKIRTEGSVSIYSNGNLIASDTGEIQLTDYGISGIPAFQVSRYVSKALNRQENVYAAIDFFPNKSLSEFFSLLREQKKNLGVQKAENFLTGIFNKNLSDLFLKLAKIEPNKSIAELTKQDLSAICNIIKNFRTEIIGVNSFENAQVCTGGVDTKEINPNTMESKIHNNLYFTGEILDVDGICGGYNLQWAWASGFIAGKSASEKGK